MKIAIIGVGSVGRALARGWAKHGHEIFFGVRDRNSEKVIKLLGEIEGAQAGLNPQAAAFGDVIVLATPWDITEALVKGLGDLKGKVIFDCTNPLNSDLSGLQLAGSTSAGEQVAAWAGGAKVVKIFNTIGSNIMENPQFGDERATLCYCGDDIEAKALAGRLAAELGFETVDAGPLSEARLLEPFALLWIHLALFRGQGREIAFKLLRR